MNLLTTSSSNVEKIKLILDTYPPKDLTGKSEDATKEET